MLVDTLHEEWKVTSHLGRLIDDDEELMSYQILQYMEDLYLGLKLD